MTSPKVGPIGSVLVTGGALRVGAALSRRFARAGWGVVIHYNRSAGPALDLKTQLRQDGATAHIINADLSDPASVESLVSRALEIAPGLRVLINCAAVFEADTTQSPERARWEISQAVNAFAPARLAADLHAHVEGAIVVNILDQKLANPNPDYFSYTVSKAALAETTRLQAMAFAPRTQVIGLAPGLLLPSGDQTEAEYERSAGMNLLSRPTTPDDLAEAALMAASGALGTGEVMYVDGGQHLVPQARDVMFLVRGET